MPNTSAIKFIEKVIAVHGTKYNYSKSIHHEAKEQITVCPVHNETLPLASSINKLNIVI